MQLQCWLDIAKEVLPEPELRRTALIPSYRIGLPLLHGCILIYESLINS